VWLGNSRGSTFSDKHVRLSGDSREFWDFTHHEIGLHDVSATIDYILKKTKLKSLHYIGHSQGTAALLVLLSMKPEYNDKIKQAHLISPAVFLERADNTLGMQQVRIFVGVLFQRDPNTCLIYI
jgi:lysosomal acid lipase/cholesteryl ester hydrolase